MPAHDDNRRVLPVRSSVIYLKYYNICKYITYIICSKHAPKLLKCKINKVKSSYCVYLSKPLASSVNPGCSLLPLLLQSFFLGSVHSLHSGIKLGSALPCAVQYVMSVSEACKCSCPLTAAGLSSLV